MSQFSCLLFLIFLGLVYSRQYCFILLVLGLMGLYLFSLYSCLILICYHWSVDYLLFIHLHSSFPTCSCLFLFILTCHAYSMCSSKKNGSLWEFLTYFYHSYEFYLIHFNSNNYNYIVLISPMWYSHSHSICSSNQLSIYSFSV